jgi:hypothetical protein
MRSDALPMLYSLRPLSQETTRMVLSAIYGFVMNAA